MSAIKALQLLKDAATELVGLEKEVPKKVELAQEKLDNDAVIEAEAFEAGQAVFIVNEDERVALPVGEYTLVDGRMLVVTEEGMIDTIGDAPAEEVEEEVEAAEEFVTKTEFNEVIDSIKAMFSKEKEEIEDKAKVDLKKAEDDLELSKEKEVKLQKEIDNKPDANPIKIKPKSKVKLSEPKTSKGRLLNYVINK